MPFIPTSRIFYDEFTGLGGGGVTYLNALQGDKITAVIEGYFYWAITDSKMSIVSADKTISLYYSPINKANGTSFLTAGFKEGDTFDVVGSASNDGPYTIASVTDTVITTVEALVDEANSPSVSVYGTTPITDMNYFYNLIPNSDPQNNFVSATDKDTLQKYSATGLDANVGASVPLTIGTKSFAWVTDIVAGLDGEGFIEGMGIADYKQSFKITTVFYMAKIWANDLYNNYISRLAPADYQKGSHLKHICLIEGVFDIYDPAIAHSGQLTQQDGLSGWFNQSNSQSLPEYGLVSISYQNNVTSEYLSQLDASIVNLVTITLRSRTGKFVSTTSNFILNHFLCPTDEADYINTDTTLLQNIRLDKAQIIADSADINGIEFGTEYQSIKDISVEVLDGYNAMVTFLVDYSAETKAILQARTAGDRLYSFVVSCQDIGILTTKNVDRVNVICDFNVADYDQRDSTLLALSDFINCFTFPNSEVFENNNIVGYEGDPSYIEIPLLLEGAPILSVTPTLQSLKVEIVATKTDEDDFVLESKIFNTSTVRKLNDKQTIEIETERGFIYPDSSPWNRADIIRNESIDTGTQIGYLVRYAFALRFETWLEAVQKNDGYSYDIFKDIEDVSEAWKQYSTGYGWELKLRMTASVKGYTDVVTDFQAETTFEILSASEPSNDGNKWILRQKYYNEAGLEVDGLIIDEKTRVVQIFGGDPTVFPAGVTELNAYMYEIDNDGSVFDRRIASTDFDSEDDSPFSAEDLPTLNGVVSETISANLRMSIFANRVEVDSWYTSPELANPTRAYIGARLDYAQANIILQENYYAILQEDGFFILR